MPMPMPQRPLVLLVVARHRLEHLPRRRHRMQGCVRIVDRRAEQGEKAVAEKLVHDAAVAVDDVDQDGESVVEPLDHILSARAARAAAVKPRMSTNMTAT